MSVERKSTSSSSSISGTVPSHQDHMELHVPAASERAVRFIANALAGTPINQPKPTVFVSNGALFNAYQVCLTTVARHGINIASRPATQSGFVAYIDNVNPNYRLNRSRPRPTETECQSAPRY